MNEKTIDLHDLLQNALKKIQGNKEKDLCKYLPGQGGHMHHFTMKKIMKQEPEKFRSLINEFILNPPQPRLIDPKPRARRKNLSKLILMESEALEILKLAREKDDNYLVSKLKGLISIKKVKRELISSIKQNRPDENLWKTYCEIVQITR